MSSVGSQLMTAEEFFDWVHRPENRDRRFELDEGEVVEMSRPGERHGTVCANVAWILGSYIRQVKKGNVVANDTGIILQRDPDSVKGPDVASMFRRKNTTRSPSNTPTRSRSSSSKSFPPPTASAP